MTSNAPVSPNVNEIEDEVFDFLDSVTRQRQSFAPSFVPVWEMLIEYRRKKQWNDHYSRKGWEVSEGREEEEKLGLEFARAYLTWRDSQGRSEAPRVLANEKPS